MEQVRASIEDLSSRWLGAVVISGVGTYVLLFLLNVAMIVSVAWFEPLHGFSTLERSELHQLASFGGVYAEYEGVSLLLGGQESDRTGYYHAGNTDLSLWIAVSGLVYAVAAYLTSAALDERTDGPGYEHTAIAMGVPFAVLALWRASAFGTRVSHGNVFTAQPARTFVGALLMAHVCGLIGSVLARWRHE